MPQLEYKGIPVIPSEGEKQDPRKKFDMTPEQESRAKYVTKRINLMQNEKSKYIARKRMALMLYDGVFRLTGDPIGAIKKHEIVAPLARIFVEAKTAEEVRAFSDFQFFPVEDEDDAWRAELHGEVVEHVRRVTHARSKRHELIRMKNIIGVSVKWKGFRGTMVKMNITKAVNEDGVPTEWEEKDMPGESEIFEDIVDPIKDFLIDPNAHTMNDALDCAIYFRLNAEEVGEVFWDKKMFDTDGLAAGSDGMVEGLMYFKKPSGRPDMFCIYMWPSAGYGVEGLKPGHIKEVYYGALPDEHKMLPFVSYHNVPTFTHGFFEGVARSGSGEAATPSGGVNGKQKFWSYAGDPEIIMDLVELRTSFGRSMYKACDLASRSIVATEGNARFDTSRDWEHGDQAIGMKGKYDISTFGTANISAFQVTLDDLYQLCIQAIGVDPRNLADTKSKTYGETLVQRETSMRRLEENIAFNEENGEIRDGMITHKLVEQHYIEPKVVRLTGLESPEELEKFDHTEGEHPRTGGPLLGKRYRRIRTKKPMREMKAVKGKKPILKRADYGTFSFIARPEYIRTSGMDIAVVTTRRAGELMALKAQQLKESIELFVTLLPYAQPSPSGAPPLIDPNSLPPIEQLIDGYMTSLGISGKKKVRGGVDEKTEKLKSAFMQYKEGVLKKGTTSQQPV